MPLTGCANFYFITIESFLLFLFFITIESSPVRIDSTQVIAGRPSNQEVYRTHFRYLKRKLKFTKETKKNLPKNLLKH